MIQKTNTELQIEHPNEKSTRLYYLDWLQVLTVLGVFLFHAVHPFDELGDWHIKNADKSDLATLFGIFFTPWGMPFFFFMTGATSWFSLRQRTPGRYARERVTRLLIPFTIGVIVLTPIQAYYELIHKGWWKGGSFIDFMLSSEARIYFFTEYHQLKFNPEIFSNVGYHLWFVAFLFAYALLALPVFTWLKNDPSKRLVGWLARWAKWPGGLLVFVIPLALVRFILQNERPSNLYGWVDFIYLLLFFVAGHILIADERFLQAIRRDWWLYLILGIACMLFFLSMAVGVPVIYWMESPGTPGFYLIYTVLSLNSWCWTMVLFYIGMRFLDSTNQWLQYGREASYPFFWIHHPVIFLISFYVVQWEAPLLIKMLVIAVGSFLITLGLLELLVKRVRPVRALFGMRPKQ